MIRFDKKWLLFLPVFVAYLAGMFVDIMEIDAAQYAAMSLEMLNTGNYLEIYYRGEDYIDKPPLLFWVSALSFKLFGVSNFSYKLPSVLFTFFGLFATYNAGKRLYSEQAGFLAALTLASCQAWFLINNDVRTDTILASSTIFAVWQLIEFNQKGRLIHIALASLGIAGAMLAKGPIGLMVPGLALATDFILKRQWAKFFQWQWIILLLLVFVLLLPMMYGLYTQYDLSNGKQTYNGVITSGLKFYFWTQSFGRLTGSSTWANETDPFFFLHTFLWSFLPWSIFAVAGFISSSWRIWKLKFHLQPKDEAMTIGGILFPFIAFSLSHYKLPHYIYVTFPLIAVVGGKYLSDLLDDTTVSRKVTAMRFTHSIIALVLVVLAGVLASYCFNLIKPGLIIFLVTGVLMISLFTFRNENRFQYLVLPAFIGILTTNFVLSLYVYPTLLTFQSETVVARMAAASPSDEVVGYKAKAYSLDFYYGQEVPLLSSLEILKERYPSRQILIYTSPEGYSELRESGWKILEETVQPDFHVSTLTPEFLNPATRNGATRNFYFLRVEAEP